MNYVQLLEDVKHEVIRFFQKHANEHLTYHNLAHTESVVFRAAEIGQHYNLDDKDFFIVSAAAWFHDIGYYMGGPQDHEARGADMAADFLRSRGVGEEVITEVRNAILATYLPQQPKSLLQEIVADADLYHLGTGAFPEQNKILRDEMSWRKGEKISKKQWRVSTINLLTAHHYHTDYARNRLNAGKAKNLQNLIDKINSDNQAPGSRLTAALPTENLKSDKPSRGIETMFRISSNNHQRLSDMADNKAHIMITTTSIILSVLLSVLLRKLEDNPNLIIPTMLLMAVCVITMVFCIIATRPSIPEGRFTHKDIDEKKVNLLFFGNFYRMSYEDYDEGMRAMMNDREFLYGSLTRDVYSQGIVLGRKYKLLRVGYNVFMYGIVASVIAFVISVIVYSH